ncbi:twin-arginine translocation signal domain-containing protein [Streptomyces sp. NPDC004561]
MAARGGHRPCHHLRDHAAPACRSQRDHGAPDSPRTLTPSTGHRCASKQGSGAADNATRTPAPSRGRNGSATLTVLVQSNNVTSHRTPHGTTLPDRHLVDGPSPPPGRAPVVSRRSFLAAAGATTAAAALSPFSPLASTATAAGVSLPVKLANNSGHDTVYAYISPAPTAAAGPSSSRRTAP